MKRAGSCVVLLLLLIVSFQAASAEIPSNMKWGAFAIVKADSLLFVTDFASTEIVGPVAKYTPVLCMQGVLNSDSSKYIYVMPFEIEETQVHTSGYIARTGLFFISLSEYTDIICGLRTAEEIMASPSGETKDNDFFEIADSSKSRVRTAVETNLFVSSRPDFGVREIIPANTEIIILMQSSMDDEGQYCFVLDPRTELTGFVSIGDIVR